MPPEGWIETTLGDVLALCRNGVSVKQDAGAGGIPVTRIETISRGVVDPTKVGYSGIALGERDSYLLQQGDILFSHINSTPHIGKTAIYKGTPSHLIHGMNLLLLRAGETIIPEFLHAALQTKRFRASLLQLVRPAVNQASVNISNLKTLTIVLPPIAEQRRVVDLLAAIELAIETAHQQLDAVAETRAAMLAEAMKPRKGWAEAKIEEVLEESVGGVWGVDPGLDEVDVTVYRSTDFGPRSQLRHPGGVRRSVKAHQLGKRQLREGDVLLEKSGGGPNQPVGRVVRVPSLTAPSICGNFIHLLRADRTRIDPEYLFYVLDSWHGTGRTLAFQAATTGIRNLRTKGYLAEAIALPSLSEQRRAVDLLSAVDAVGDTAIQQETALREARTNLLADLLSGNHPIPKSYDRLLEFV